MISSSMTRLKFENIPIHECGEALVDLSQYDFVLDHMYFKQGLSPEPRMFLRKSVADKLAKIQKELKNYKFKIWDGFRSRAVQQAVYEKFWEELHSVHPDWDEEKLLQEASVFVTVPNNPNRIPPHATGAAIDLTLVDMQDKELDMGTGFDHFGPEAASLYFEERSGNDFVKANRKILREAMRAHGFNTDKEEWWHFDYGNQKWALETGHSVAMYGEVGAI